MEESGQQLRPRDKEVLEALERDLRAVLKAREALGDKAPKFGTDGRDGPHGPRKEGGDHVLGKRRRDNAFGRHQDASDESETDDDVRRIPMPRDTPPPIPREHQRKRGPPHTEDSERRGPHALPSKPPGVEAKTVYEAKPEIRDLRKEAVSKFVPAVVRMKQDAIKGTGKLLEPEEMGIQLDRPGLSQAAQQAQNPRLRSSCHWKRKSDGSTKRSRSMFTWRRLKMRMRRRLGSPALNDTNYKISAARSQLCQKMYTIWKRSDYNTYHASLDSLPLSYQVNSTDWLSSWAIDRPCLGPRRLPVHYALTWE
jgi:hypothetical protein